MKNAGSMGRAAAVVAAVFVTAWVARPAAASLLNAEWKFDEASGTTAADSVAAHNGTLSGGASFVAGGEIGNRVQIDGNPGTTISVTDNAAHRPSTITVSIWVKTADTRTFRGLWDKIENSVGFALDVNAGTPRLDVDGTSLSSGVSIANGVWHQVTGLYSSGTAKIYIDGVLKASTGSATYTPKTTPLGMGGDGVSTLALAGSLDDAAVWNVALTDGEAAALYNVAQYGALNYDAGKADQLFSVYTAGSGATSIGTLTWRYTTGLTGAIGAVVQNGNTFAIRLDAAGNGIAAIPEPASLMLLGLGAMGLLCRRKS